MKVDVEKPEFESESFRVYIYHELKTQENLRLATNELPVHMRYHRPRSSAAAAAPSPATAALQDRHGNAAAAAAKKRPGVKQDGPRAVVRIQVSLI